LAVLTPERRDALGRDARGPDGAPIAGDLYTLRLVLPTPERRDALGRDARGPDGAPIAPDCDALRLTAVVVIA
jgi:hypothetical protein